MLVCNFDAHLVVPCGISWEKVELSGSLGDQNTTTTRYFDQEDKPMVDNSGAHKYVYARDEYGLGTYQVFGLNDVYLGQCSNLCDWRNLDPR